MANCPKCGEHLKITDWRQKCPYCGVNMVLYDEQERLMQDADIAEVQYYHFQKKIDRLKASFIGTKLAIVRIFTSILPVGPIFLPLISGKVVDPFKPIDGGVSLLDIINNIDGLGKIGDAMNMNKTATIFLLAAMGLFVISLLATVLHFIFLSLACSPKGKKRNLVMDIIILASTVLSMIAIFAMPKGGAVEATVGIGGYLYLLLQVVNVAIDYKVLKDGIPVHHKQCYVGGIPVEEYFEMQEKGMTTAEIRAIQYERMQKMQEEKEAELAKQAEEAERKEAEEATVDG